MLLESTVLSVAGGLIGLAAAYIGMPAVLPFFAAQLPHVTSVAIDPVVALSALAVAVLASLLFTLISMTRLSRAKRFRELDLGAGSKTEGRPKEWALQSLIVTQVALALLLLVGSGLMIRTFEALQDVDPGFLPSGDVTTFQLMFADPTGSLDAEQAVRMQQTISDALAAVPGVEMAAFAAFNDALPLDNDGRQARISVDEGTRAERAHNVEVQLVSPGFFETIGTPLLAGRGFDWTDVYFRRRVALISERLARAEWGSAEAAIGRRIRTDDAWEVIGVLPDVHHDGLDRPAPEVAAFPLTVDDAPPGMRIASFVVRSERSDTPRFVDELEDAVQTVNGQVALANLSSLGNLYRYSMARTSLTLLLLACMSAMALLVGLIGIYGVMTHAISQRRHEIGIRIALGSTYRQLQRRFVGGALLLASIGILIGAVASVALTRLIASQLFGVDALDPATYSAVVAVLLTGAGLATYFAVRRLAGIEPLDALKAR